MFRPKNTTNAIAEIERIIDHHLFSTTQQLGYRDSAGMNAIEEIERLIDHNFNTTTHKLGRRDTSSQLINDKNSFKYRVELNGFKENEIDVKLQGDDLIIQAELKEENDTASIQRTFFRRLVIPKDVQKETIKCVLSDNGWLYVIGQKKVK